MTIFQEITKKIIHEQEQVIGPLAWIEAGKVNGLSVVPEREEVNLNSSDEKDVVNKLVYQYEKIFGQASREVCKDAVASLIADLPQTEVPSSLQ